MQHGKIWEGLCTTLGNTCNVGEILRLLIAKLYASQHMGVEASPLLLKPQKLLNDARNWGFASFSLTSSGSGRGQIRRDGHGQSFQLSHVMRCVTVSSAGAKSFD